MSRMLQSALQHGYAVGYFEAWDQYSLEGVLEAAEELDAPVILGFGGMMVDQSWFNRTGLAALGALGRAVADNARVPVSLLLNEVETFSQVVRGITYGFNAVMLDTSYLPFAQNVVATRQVVDVAHPVGVTVEAELGQLPDASEGNTVHGHGASVTDPEEARVFVRETRVDALAVSVGNVHMMVGREAEIDFDRLEALHSATDVPLVIHGGTSFPVGAVKRAIAHGVAKFNVGTILKRVFLEGIKAGLASALPGDGAQQLIGSHLDVDVLNAGKEKMKAEVARLIRLYGGVGQAASII